MTDILATDEWRIVVPLRFRRFNHGTLPALDCPEIDDRGYVKGTRPAPWGDTTVRGPSLGVTVTDTVRVRVLREDIDPGAPLVATSSDPAVLEIATPAGVIEASGEVRVRGVASGTATLVVRLGDSEGPVLAEADVRVHSRLRIALTPHMVRIDSGTAAGTVPVVDVARITRLVRAIWRPCGIDLTVRATVNDTIRLPSNHLNEFEWNGPSWQADARALLGLQRTRLGLAAGVRDQSINWYHIQQFTGGTPGGFGFSRATADANGTDTGVVSAAVDTGGVVPPDVIGHNLAHEIGHFFRLPHAQNRDADNAVTDTFGRRQLMYPFTLLVGGTGGFALPRFNDVGCGPGMPGCLITMKNLPHHSTDGECATARNAIHAGTWT